MGEGGFEPPKSLTTDLQSAPFGHSGIPPYTIGAGRRTRTPDLLITNPAHKVKCLILQAFRAFSLHIPLLNQQVLSGASIGKFRVVGQRVGQTFCQSPHVADTARQALTRHKRILKIGARALPPLLVSIFCILTNKGRVRFSRLPQFAPDPFALYRVTI